MEKHQTTHEAEPESPMEESKWREKTCKIFLNFKNNIWAISEQDKIMIQFCTEISLRKTFLEVFRIYNIIDR